jgi:hypothetical protein
MSPPEVRGNDDGKESKWFHVSDPAGLEGQMHDDRAVILDHFIGGGCPGEAQQSKAIRGVTFDSVSTWSMPTRSEPLQR